MDNVFKTLGASNHCDSHDREINNFYVTDEKSIDYLLKYEYDNFKNKTILEPCCGSGAMSKRLSSILNATIDSYDLIDRGFGTRNTNYMTTDFVNKYDVIITNPPYYKETHNMIIKAINDVKKNGRVYMFLKILFLESQTRYRELFSKYPPKTVYIFSHRLPCYINDDRTKKDSAQAYAWYCWEKDYNGTTELKWITKDENIENNSI